MHLSPAVRAVSVQAGDVIVTDDERYVVAATTRTGKMTLQDSGGVGVASFAHDTLNSDVVEVRRR